MTNRLLSVLLLAGTCTALQAQTPAANAPAATSTPATEAAFKRADANGDGKLSREEVARLPAIAERFAELDTDKDGLLSLEELLAAGSTPVTPPATK